MNNPAQYGPRQAQPLDDMMGRGRGGWGDFIVGASDLGSVADAEQTSATIDKANREQLSRDAAEVFSTAAGKRVLEHLADVTLRRPHFMLGMTAEQTALYAHFREGQNSLFSLLLKMIADGRNEVSPNRTLDTL